jgi:2,5-diketo-D-gluconate reductase B
MGYRHIDTAQMYGNEAEVGQGLADSDVPRDRVFLTTKVWMDRLHDGDLRASVEESLRKLGTGDVDLLLIHWPNPEVPLGESLRAMQDLQAEGKVKYTGVSNFPVELMREALERKGADIVCNQVEYHPFLSQQPVLDYARDHGLFVTAYCPLAKGRAVQDPTLTEIGRKHGKSPAQVALRWLVQQDKVAAIPKAAKPEHARANLEIFDFELDAEDRARIGRLDGRTRLINPSWAPQWDEAA